MKLTENERKLLENASILLGKIGADKASEEIEYVLEANEDEEILKINFEQIRNEENEILDDKDYTKEYLCSGCEYQLGQICNHCSNHGCKLHFYKLTPLRCPFLKRKSQIKEWFSRFQINSDAKVVKLTSLDRTNTFDFILLNQLSNYLESKEINFISSGEKLEILIKIDSSKINLIE